MVALNFNLHPAQTVIHNSDARFLVCACGRRFGKTYYAVIRCIIEALQETNKAGQVLDSSAEVVYIGVDREQAKRNAWHYFKELAAPVIERIHENTCCITLINGVRIRLLGMDNPDAARGMKLRFAVLDEYADMPSHVWKEIIRPALMDVQGGAMFIGTPKGKNHFYQLYVNALTKPPVINKAGEEMFPWNEWEAFNFQSSDNNTIVKTELDSIALEYTNGSEDLHEQEIEAKFISRGGKLFHADQFKIDSTEPRDGTYYMAVDLAGFGTETGKRHAEIKKLDETAIAIVKVHEFGWWVKDIKHGRWGVRETALQIVKAAYDNLVSTVGIEKGALANAVAPYLTEYMNQFNRWLNIQPLTHGNKRKYDRIEWALQGRLQKGQITLNRGPWNEVLIEQAVDFPSKLTHDDLLDSLSYIDQQATVIYFDMDDFPKEYVPLDEVSGY